MGDCCPGECLDTIADGCPDANQGAGGCYSGSEDGSWCGACTDCIDEDSVDNAPGGECEDGGGGDECEECDKSYICQWKMCLARTCACDAWK